MNKTITHLRTFRKHTDVTQDDIAMLLQLKGNTIISRSEKGFRTPSIEILVVYHLLFDTPLEALIKNHIEIFKSELLQRLPKLMEKIEKVEVSKNRETRINFLKETLNRLTQTTSA